MTLLVLGAGGQLGAELLAAASAGGRPVVGLGHGECDITDPASVDRALTEHRPTAVVNCAAWTAVDAAEDHPEDARRVNALGAGNVADACQRHGARLCHVSTDYVFDGAGGSALNEDATPHPLSVYGASKLAGEDTVRERCRDHLIARTSWVFGQRGPNFVLTVLTLIDSGRAPLRMVADQHGSPTWTGHLTPALLRLIDVAPAGTYHLAGSGAASRFEQAAAIAEAAAPGTEVLPARAADFPARAARPAFSALDNRAWRSLGEPDLPPWREGIHAYLAELGRLTR